MCTYTVNIFCKDCLFTVLFSICFPDMSADILNYSSQGGVSSTLFAIPGLPPPSAVSSSHSSRTRRPK